jgi:integrase/recombinase XerC
VTAVLLDPEPASLVLPNAEPVMFRLRSGAYLQLPPGEWGEIAKEWGRSLLADNKSENTIRIYLYALRRLGEWAVEQKFKVDGKTQVGYGPTTVTTSALRQYIAELIEGSSPGNAKNHFRSLCTFYVWMVDEDEVDRSPFDRMKTPQVPEKPIPIVTYDMMSALLDTCSGKTFVDRRDTAILRVLWDTGGRRNEIGSLKLDNLDLDIECILVHGKGRRDRTIPLGAKTVQALSRYLRLRGRHPQHALPDLWLGSTGQGPLRVPGIRGMVSRRAAEAGVGHVHPHMFRHALAHYWQLEGGNETDLMRIMGWKSPEMLRRYGASAAAERAHKSHRALRIGDRV